MPKPSPMPDAPSSALATGAALPHATQPRAVPEEADLDHPHLYFNRELSTLDFNARVLHQGIDHRTPLLERLFFLAITGSNLDEFFRKRVGGLKRQEAAGVRDLSPDGRTPQEQLALIREAVLVLYGQMETLWDKLRRHLAEEADLHIHDYGALASAQQRQLDAYFKKHIFPILTPLAVDPGHPFPFISNLSLSLAVMLRHPDRHGDQFARIKVPVGQGRWIPLAEPNHVVPMEQVIAHNLDELFRGMEILSAHAFRVTRNADIRRDEEEAEDLLAMISEELRERRFAPVVRLEVDRAMPDAVRSILLEEMDLCPDDVYESDGPLGHADLMALVDRSRRSHLFTPWKPLVPRRLAPLQDETNETDIFAIIRRGDVLVHHPYDSFDASVQRFIEAAANDDRVLAIKQTLYRTSADSPIVRALIKAAEAGKQVAVLVEVKARFDEASNIEWGQMLEKYGVHVTYGLVGLKTHTKVTLVIREEDGEPRTYCHIGTGNYNATTARRYTDLGLFTCTPEVGQDVANLFHYLTGYAPEQHYHTLLVAPQHMRHRFAQMIDEEIRRQQEHGDGRIIAKMNALNDTTVIQHLYRASRAGVQVDLIVRGHSRLRPGLSGYSDTIRVISILGRFLEHSRIYYFHRGGTPRVFIGSADWMSRNLDDRVEAVAEVSDAALKKRLIHVLETALADQRSAWELHADGRYTQRQPGGDGQALGFQERLMQEARQRAAR